MPAKLTDTQAAVLKTATSRRDGNVEPLPSNLRGGARAKVIEGLLARGLVTESESGHLLTDAGYAAVGKRRPIPKGVQKVEVTPPTIRPGTKLAGPYGPWHDLRHDREAPRLRGRVREGG